MLHDRIVFADNQTALLMALQAAGLIQIRENVIAGAGGVVLLSWIGEPYDDGKTYCLLTLDDALANIAAIDAALAANIDPSRTPLRIRAGTLISDPDEAKRVAFLGHERTLRERRYRLFATRYTEEQVATLQLRIAAFRAGRLTAMDNAIAGMAMSEMKVRWQEGDDFTRAELDVLFPGLTAAQRTALFNAALEI